MASTTKGGDLDSLRCMITNCGRQIWTCVSDGTCRAGLSCLNGCAFNDQVIAAPRRAAPRCVTARWKHVGSTLVVL